MDLEVKVTLVLLSVIITIGYEVYKIWKKQEEKKKPKKEINIERDWLTQDVFNEFRENRFKQLEANILLILEKVHVEIDNKSPKPERRNKEKRLSGHHIFGQHKTLDLTTEPKKDL